MSEPNCLVKGFEDLTFLLSTTFTNEQHQERASNPNYKINTDVIKTTNIYLMKCVWAYHSGPFVHDYLITGEYNLDFLIYCPTSKSSYTFATSVGIEKKILQELISKYPFNKKETNLNPVILETQGYIYNREDSFSMKIKFKPERGGLVMMTMEIEMPHNICDEWYIRFAKYNYQRVCGPKLF
jgi:hypothetical protein